MKRIILIIIIITVSSLAIILILGIEGKLKEQKITSERIKHLPVFSMVATDNNPFSTDVIEEGPLLLIYYHPDCEHCRHELTELFNSSFFESDIKLMLVSNAPRDTVISFLGGFKQYDNERCIILFDTAYLFEDLFGTPVIPSAFLYNGNLDLIESYSGEYKIETILNSFRQSEQN